MIVLNCHLLLPSWPNHVSFFFTIESIQSETAFISQLIAGVDDNKFLSRLQEHVGNSNPDRSRYHSNSFFVCEDICYHKKVTVTSRHNNSQFYQVVAASIFYEYLKFAGCCYCYSSNTRNSM